jgi:hypothetical protein
MSHTQNNSTTDGLERKTFNDEIQEIPFNSKEKLIGTYDDFLYGQELKPK